MAEYGYDFTKAGVPGLKAVATYLKGSGIDNATGGDLGEWGVTSAWTTPCRTAR